MATLPNIQKLAGRLYRSNRVAGVEYLQLSSGSLVWNVVVMERQKGKAEFAETAAQLDSWEAVKELLGNDTPVFLAINSRAVIHRKTADKGGSDSNALQSVFPNASLEDFYLQRIALQQGEIISIARKEATDQLLAQALEAGLTVLHLSLGPFAVQQILPLLAEDLHTLELNSHIITIENQAIQNFQNNTNPVSGTERISATDSIDKELLVATALAIWGMSDLQAEGLETPKLAERQEEFLYKKVFQTLGIGLLGFFFVALLINYLLFSNLQTANAKLDEELQQKQFVIQTRDTLRSQLQRKSDFFGSSTVGKATKTSFYADQLAASLPSSIQLTRLDIFPKIKERQQSIEATIPKYETGIIRINGQCSGSVFYNNWKKAIQELYWVEELHNLYYKNVSEDVGEFELEIKIKLSELE